MSDHISTERMNEALDGLLTSSEMDDLEHHFRDCDVCRNGYSRLSEVVAALRALPRAAKAPEDAWSGIATRISAPGTREAPQGATVLRLPTAVGVAPGRRFTFSAAQLASAAAIVAMLSAGTVWVAVRGDASQARTVGTSVPFVDAGGAAARAVSTEGGRYVEVVEQLERILEEGREVLTPETLMTIQESLGTLDQAIADIETALADDPNSDLLLRMLSNHQRTKLSVLQRAAAAVQAQA